MISTRIWQYFLALAFCEGLLCFKVHAQTPKISDRVDLGVIEYDPISEASGIAASQKNPGVLWTHNDSGDKNRLYAFNTRGKHLGTFMIAGSTARDWEDLALGPGPVEGQQYLYIGDIGDNDGQFDFKYIYRISEPEIDSMRVPGDTTLFGVETITVRYPDGNRDAETLMVDPLTKDIYIISKRDSSSRVYRAPYPQSTTQPILMEHVANLPFGGAVSGDISSAGNEILIKTYVAIYYWSRSPQQDLWRAFDKAPVKVPYVIEPQGEAVCWKPDAKGYYTLSEEFRGIPTHLYFYQLQTGDFIQAKKLILAR